MSAPGRAGAAAGLVLLAACAAPAARHVGPVSGICAASGAVFTCSQAGVFEGATGELRPLPAPAFRPLRLAAVGNGREAVLAVCGGRPGLSGELALVTPAGRERAAATVAGDLVYGVAVAPRGDAAALACADGRVLIVDLPRLQVERVWHRHGAPCRAVAFSPDGAWLASAGLDGQVVLAAAHGEASPRVLNDHTAGVECLAFSADGQRLASGARDGKVRLHGRDGRLIRTYQRLGSAVLSIAPSERGFYAGLRGGAVLRLDPERARAEQRHHLGEPVHALLARPEGLIAGVSGRALELGW